MGTDSEDKVVPIEEKINTAVFHMCAVSIWILASLLWVFQFSHSLILLVVIPLITAAYFLGNRASRTRISIPAVILADIILYLIARLVSHLLTANMVFPSVIGVTATYVISETVFWSAVLFSVVFTSRFLSMKNPLFLSLETALIAILLTSPFWGHRMGSINRPLELIDQTWYYGIDPRYVFIAIGLIVCFILFFVISNRKHSKKSVLDIVIFSIVLLALVFCIPFARIEKYVSKSGGIGEDKGKPATASPSPATGSPQTGGSSSSGTPEQGESSGKDSDDDQTKMGDSTSSGSETPVAVVNLHDDYTPLDGYFYFRQTAFSLYNGIRLVKDTSGRADKDIFDEFPGTETKVASDNSMFAELDRNKNRNDICYRYLETTVAMITSHTRPFGLVNLYKYTPIKNLDPGRFDRIYRVGSFVRTKPYEKIVGAPMGSKTWDKRLWAQYTDAPSDPRYTELASEIISTIKPRYSKEPLIQALAVKLWLEENCIYSRKCAHAGAQDPTASFLFGDRTGYCVYTAHSACYLFRTLGIPSRVCGGYAVNERFRRGSSTVLILGKYSHLWPEIYVEGFGWLIIDISPKRTTEPPTESPDQGLQSMMGDMLRKGSQNIKEKTPVEPRLKIDPRPALIALLIIILFTLLLLYSVKVFRRFRPYFCGASELPRITFISALDIMVEGGFIRDYGETRESFADKLKSISPSFMALTIIHLGSFLGKADNKDIPKNRILELYHNTYREVSKNISPVRRLLGALNPISWLFSK